MALRVLAAPKPAQDQHRAPCLRRVPVQSMQWFFSGTWYDMSRTSDNYFVIQAILSQPLILPAQVKITSIFGDEVIDTVATSTFSVGILLHHGCLGQTALCHSNDSCICTPASEDLSLKGYTSAVLPRAG